ncbi:hypothetical protein [Streptomyces niveus]|uniref:hypothetical protein n=1 Tax=Streptomyces niveus TaxID=193462 RepID=UPI0036A45825
MSHHSRALQAAYLAGAFLLGLTAIQRAAHDVWPQALAATVVTVLLVDGAVRAADYARTREQLRAAIEEQTRRAARARHAAAITKDTEAIWHDLLAACCLTAWETGGRDHDTATCTRTENHR